MAANPLVPQGTINRLRGSIIIPGFPSLNVTSPFLGKAGISLTFEGVTTQFHETMTGAVTSPEPYQMVTARVNLLKTQNLAQQYEAQRLLLSTIGALTVRTDTASLADYSLDNCAIMNVAGLDFAGSNADYIVEIKGQYYINSSLFDLT